MAKKNERFTEFSVRGTAAGMITGSEVHQCISVSLL